MIAFNLAQLVAGSVPANGKRFLVPTQEEYEKACQERDEAMEQSMKDAEGNAGKENKPEEQSDSMQEAEKSDDKPEEEKKEKTQFQRKNTDANPTSPQ